MPRVSRCLWRVHPAAAGGDEAAQALRAACVCFVLRLQLIEEREERNRSDVFTPETVHILPGREGQVTGTPDAWQGGGFPALARVAGAFMDRQ